MIVRILNEGQWDLPDAALAELNQLDESVEQAVAAEDADQLASALHELLDKVRRDGTRLSDDDLHDSSLILPAADSSLDDLKALLSESDEGLVPN